jgi:2-oxoglutarate dehydrogenase E1 component
LVHHTAHAYSGLYHRCGEIDLADPDVNGDDPEAVVFCARMAAEFRMRFGRVLC